MGKNRKVPSSCLGAFTLLHIPEQGGSVSTRGSQQTLGSSSEVSVAQSGQGGHRGWVRAAALLPCESAPLDSPWSPDSQPGLSHCQGPTSGVLIYMVWVAAGRGLGLGIDWKSTKLLKYHEVENQPP